ncbi:MAG: oligosaccharide flippase family protein [Pseudomonadota bacterium]
MIKNLASSVGWNLAAGLIERLLGVTQAFFIARILGLEAFGTYGLIFATIALFGSVIGLQLGLTASVNVARWYAVDAIKTASIIRLCNLTCLSLSSFAIAVSIVAPTEFAAFFLGSPERAALFVLLTLFTGLSAFAGVQEGILQGLGRHRLVASLRAVFSFISLAIVIALAQAADLHSVMTALTITIALKALTSFAVTLTLTASYRVSWSWDDIWRERRLLVSFSAPAFLASLVTGAVAWLGFFLVGQTANGSRDLAILTAAQQWRGVAVQVTSVSAGVVVPSMSRLIADGNARELSSVHRINQTANLAMAVLMTAFLALATPLVLRAYGTGFEDGAILFWVAVTVIVPATYANVVYQRLVSHQQLWRQLGFHLAHGVPFALGCLAIVPAYGAQGLAIWALLSMSILAFVLARTEAPSIDEAAKTTRQDGPLDGSVRRI